MLTSKKWQVSAAAYASYKFLMKTWLAKHWFWYLLTLAHWSIAWFHLASIMMLGGDLPLRMTVIAWKRFFAGRQDWDIVPIVRPPSPASVMTPTTNFSCGSPAIVSICYIGCYHLSVSSTTVYVSVATVTNCLNELLCSKTKTTLWECCIEWLENLPYIHLHLL